VSTSGQEPVIPVAMERVSSESEFRHLLIGNLDPRRVGVVVQFTFHRQTGFRSCTGNEVDDHLVADARIRRPQTSRL